MFKTFGLATKKVTLLRIANLAVLNVAQWSLCENYHLTSLWRRCAWTIEVVFETSLRMNYHNYDPGTMVYPITRKHYVRRLIYVFNINWDAARRRTVLEERWLGRFYLFSIIETSVWLSLLRRVNWITAHMDKEVGQRNLS